MKHNAPRTRCFIEPQFSRIFFSLNPIARYRHDRWVSSATHKKPLRRTILRPHLWTLDTMRMEQTEKSNSMWDIAP